MLHYLYVIADGCITLGELVIKDRGLRVPISYSDTFDVLGASGIIDRGFAYEFARIASFRNFLAHDYEEVDAAFICAQILAKLDDVDIFLQQIRSALQLEQI